MMDHYHYKDFLLDLDKSKNKTRYARITALTFDELPIETIEGKVTGGNVNIDGASAVRRTCSLSLVAQDININEFYWGLENKIKVEIGLRNFINSNYSDIIWFSQGIYIITGFNTSMTSNTYNISISGQDKMCLLNGNVGGSLPASIDFGVEEIWDNNDVIYNKRLIALNNLTSIALSIGQVLKVPSNEVNTYVVKKGDSLYSIASRYNTTVDEIRRINNLTTNLLSIGQELLIPA